MPLYEYRCHRCDKKFEVIQHFSDEPLTTHEGCGGEVERLISAPTFQFKGTGWYVTDYGRGGNSANGSNGKSEAKSESKVEPKAAKKDAKPAATPSADK